MKKEKLPDGFPVEQNEPMKDYPCDNCGTRFDAQKDPDGIQASGRANAGDPYHCYEFCCEDCAYEFAVDNGLVLHKSDDDTTDDYDLTLAKEGENPGYAPAADNSIPDDNQALSEAEELERLRKFNNRLQKQVKVVEKAESEWLKATGAVQSAKEEARALKEVFDAESKTLAVMVKNGVEGVGNELPGFSPEELEANDSEPAVVDLSQYSVSEIGISESVYDKLQDAKILTVEDLRVYLNQDPRNREKIPGIGTEKLNALTDKLNAFTEPLYKK